MQVTTSRKKVRDGNHVERLTASGVFRLAANCGVVCPNGARGLVSPDGKPVQSLTTDLNGPTHILVDEKYFYVDDWDPERKIIMAAKSTLTELWRTGSFFRKDIEVLRRAGIIVVLALVANLAHGQGSRTNELGLMLGATITPALRPAGSSASIDVGTGVTFQLTYARRVINAGHTALYVEFPAVAVPLQHVRSTIGVTPRNYDSFFIAPSIRIKFNTQATAAPWLSVGGGYALFDESATRRDGSHNVTRGTSTGTIQFGGGIDVRTPVKLVFPIGLRAEVRDFYSGKPAYNVNTGGGLQHNVIISGGFTFNF